MKKVGHVFHAELRTNPDGRSKGCGIVEYAHVADANRAILELNHSVLHGRNILVREDREKDPQNANRSAGYKIFVSKYTFYYHFISAIFN